MPRCSAYLPNEEGRRPMEHDHSSRQVSISSENNYVAAYIHRTVAQEGFCCNSVACYHTVGRTQPQLPLTPLDIPHAYFIALSPTFTKITNYHFHLQTGRKEMIDGVVELLLRRHSDLDTPPKDGSQEELYCSAAFAIFGPSAQLLDRLCVLLEGGTAFLQCHIIQIWGRVPGKFPQYLGRAHRYVRVFLLRKLESLNLCCRLSFRLPIGKHSSRTHASMNRGLLYIRRCH
jgi:hypothetical protein